MIFTSFYTYSFLWEQASYNNHYYFICLLGLLFCVTDTHKFFSLFAVEKSGLVCVLRSLLSNQWLIARSRATVPMWQPLLFKFIVGCVYVGGCVAKLNKGMYEDIFVIVPRRMRLDWLRGEPIRSAVSNDLLDSWIVK